MCLNIIPTTNLNQTMLTHTPSQAAALHRAEINITVNLIPDKPISPHQIPSLLSSLALVHAEANLLKQLDHQITTHPTSHDRVDHIDAHHLRRLDRLIRSIHPCANFLKAVTTTTDIRLSVESARTIAAFLHLHVAHTPDLVTALAAFVSLALQHSSSYRTAVLNSAVDLVPALHALLEQPVDPPVFHRAALPALPVLILVATHYVQMTLNQSNSGKLQGMLALAEIAVDVIANVLHSYPAQLDTLQSQIGLLSQKVDCVLSDVPEAETLQRDVHNLLQIRTKQSVANMSPNE